MTVEVSVLEGPGQALRTLFLLYLVDTSGSMEGEKIASVNAGIRNSIPELQELEKHTPGVEIVAQIITFDSEAHRIYPQPVPISQLKFTPLEVGHLSNMGAGLTLARDEFKKLADSGGKYKKPVMVVLSDGAVQDWEIPFKELLTIKLANASQRICFAVGDGADKNMLKNLTSPDQDGVFEVHDAGDLANKLNLVTVAGVEGATRGKSSMLESASGGFEVPELNSSLLPDDALMSSSDVADKLHLDKDVIF